MSVFAHVGLRAAISLIATLIAIALIPGHKVGGAFIIGQWFFLISFCVIQLPWKRMLMADRLEAESLAVLNGQPLPCSRTDTTGPCPLTVEALKGRSVDKALRQDFLRGFSLSKGEKLQQSFYKLVFPTSLAALITLLVAWKLNSYLAVMDGSTAPYLSAALDVIQFLIGSLTLIWSFAFAYAEIQAQREVNGAALS